MPVHVHGDEEEIFYVLEGSGLSWQDGRTYGVAAGDCIVHRASAEAHTIVASQDGLDVLAFGEGSDTGITWLPRAQAWWLGPRWLPADGPSPFAREVDAGPLELPEPEPQRPPTIVATRDVEAQEECRGRVSLLERELGRAAGSVRTGLNHLEIGPDARGWPHHVHSAEEELFVILEGSGTLRLGDDEHPVRAGHVVARPPASRVAHSFRASGDGLVLLAWGTRVAADVVWYPDSRKVNLRGVGIKARLEPLDYWDGEE
jgi:uncharacterized cupin superfamily protein